MCTDVRMITYRTQTNKAVALASMPECAIAGGAPGLPRQASNGQQPVERRALDPGNEQEGLGPGKRAAAAPDRAHRRDEDGLDDSRVMGQFRKPAKGNGDAGDHRCHRRLADPASIAEMSGLLEHAALDTRVAWVRDLFGRIDVDSREEHAVAFWRSPSDEGSVNRLNSVSGWLRR
jgi:hypothetical protein